MRALKVLTNHKKKAIVASTVGSMLSATQVMALDVAADTAVQDALTAGTSSVTAVVVGIIGIVAVVCGAGLVMTWLKK